MNAIRNMAEAAKDAYIVLIIAALGIFAFISAVILAWPALAYLGSKLFV
jgi:hypothetical protein